MERRGAAAKPSAVCHITMTHIEETNTHETNGKDKVK